MVLEARVSTVDVSMVSDLNANLKAEIEIRESQFIIIVFF